MGKFDRDSYNSGFARALEMVTGSGDLELGVKLALGEAKNRGALLWLPPGVSSWQLKKASREMAGRELTIIALAMATTLADDMRMPPSKLKQFLQIFNEKADIYRYNPEEFDKAANRMDSMPAVTEMCKQFMEEKE